MSAKTELGESQDHLDIQANRNKFEAIQGKSLSNLLDLIVRKSKSVGKTQRPGDRLNSRIHGNTV